MLQIRANKQKVEIPSFSSASSVHTPTSFNVRFHLSIVDIYRIYRLLRAAKRQGKDKNVQIFPFVAGSTRNRSASPYRQREVSSGSVRSGGSGGAQVNLGYGTNAWADSRRASSSVSQVNHLRSSFISRPYLCHRGFRSQRSRTNFFLARALHTFQLR